MIAEIDLDVPVRTAYNQWTQFRDFPLFMDHIAEVEQLDPTHVRFKATILGITREWDAEITEQTPDQRIAWTSTDGTSNSGVITSTPSPTTGRGPCSRWRWTPTGSSSTSPTRAAS